MKKFRCACLAFFLVSIFSLAGCGGSPDTPDGSGAAGVVSAGSVSIAPTTPLSITALSPAPGSYSTIPSSIQVTFSETTVSSAVMNPANWQVLCGSSAATYPSSVTFNSATGVANVSMPYLGYSQASGTTCTITVSPSITDYSGNVISGTLSYAYTSGGTTAATSGVYNPAANQYSVTQMSYIYYVGGSSTFSTYAPGYSSQTSPGQFSLVGLNVRTGSYVDQIQPIWMADYNSNATGETAGSTYGGSGGSSGVLMCPVVGQQAYSSTSGVLTPTTNTTSTDYTHVTGVYGTSDGYEIDSIGLICGAQDGSSTTSNFTSTVGGSGSYSFQLQCPAGTFVVAIGGYSGSYVSALQLGCQ